MMRSIKLPIWKERQMRSPSSMSTWLFPVSLCLTFDEGDVPNWHPLEVRPDSIHLALVDADLGSNVQEGILGVVEPAGPVSVAIVGDFCASSANGQLFIRSIRILTMIIPNRNPSEMLVRCSQVEISAILSTVGVSGFPLNTLY